MNKQQWISAKIAELIGEGRPQQQAIAIAYSTWENEHNKMQQGGHYEIPMAQEGVFKKQDYQIPINNNFDINAKGFYSTQGNTFPNSLTFGIPTNPNYGKQVNYVNSPTPTQNQNINPFTQPTINPLWNQKMITPQKVSHITPIDKKQTVAPANEKANTRIQRPDTSNYINEDIISPQTNEVNSSRYEDSLYGAMLTPYGEQQRQQGIDATIDQTTEQAKFSNEITRQSNQNDYSNALKYNILNPYAQGMDLDTSLTYTGQQFGEGHTGMGIAGAGLSLLKGSRNFLSGFASGQADRRLEQQMRDKLINTPLVYETAQQGGEIMYMKEGGQLTNADLLTGQYMSEVPNEQYNVEVEDKEHIKDSETGLVKEAVGETHKNGGIKLNLADGSKVLSDFTKIGAKNVKYFEDLYGINLKASHTFADVQAKYNKKIGLDKLVEEEKDYLLKVEKVTKSTMDKTTKKVNEDFLAEEIKSIAEKKKELEAMKSQAFELIFEAQEKIPKKGNGTEILNESGKPVAQQGGEMLENEEIMQLSKQYGIAPERIIQLIKEGTMKQEGGEQQPDPQQIIQAYAEMAGQDPNEVIQQLQQLPPEQQQAALQQMVQALQQGQQSNQEEQVEGTMSNPTEEGQELPQMKKGGTKESHSYGKDWTEADKKLRYEAALQQARLLGYDGNLTNKDFKKDSAWGELQKYITGKTPMEVEQYARDTRLTAKHIRDIKDIDPNIFKTTRVSINKSDDAYSEEEAKILSDAAKNSTKLPETFWTEGFNDSLGAYRYPMVPTNIEAQGIVKGVQTPITATNMNRYFSTPEEYPATTNTDITTNGDLENKVIQKEQSRGNVKNIISTEGMPYRMPPSASIAPYLQQVSLGRETAQKGSVENTLQANENARQAAYAQSRDLSPSQRAAIMANTLSTIGQTDTVGISQQEGLDMQNQARVNSFNLGQVDKEQVLNEKLKKQFEQESFATLNQSEQNWRKYYDATEADRQAMSDKIDRRNILNTSLENYQLTGNGIDYVGGRAFQTPQYDQAYLDWYKNATAAEKLAEEKRRTTQTS